MLFVFCAVMYIYGNGAMLCGRYLHECLFVWCCCIHVMALWKMLLWLELGKVSYRARCGRRVVCIARKTLYSRVYFVCTHTKYMVSGDCTPGVCTARVCRVHTAPGYFHTNQHVNVHLIETFSIRMKHFP